MKQYAKNSTLPYLFKVSIKDFKTAEKIKNKHVQSCPVFKTVFFKIGNRMDLKNFQYENTFRLHKS